MTQINLDEKALSFLVPLVVELVNEFKHRNDLVTAEDVEPLLKAKIQKVRNTGQQFLEEKSDQT